MMRFIYLWVACGLALLAMPLVARAHDASGLDQADHYSDRGHDWSGGEWCYDLGFGVYAYVPPVYRYGSEQAGPGGWHGDDDWHDDGDWHDNGDWHDDGDWHEDHGDWHDGPAASSATACGDYFAAVHGYGPGQHWDGYYSDYSPSLRPPYSNLHAFNGGPYVGWYDERGVFHYSSYADPYYAGSDYVFMPGIGGWVWRGSAPSE
jgi:hypothetical protein